ncbi:MAG: PhzF family phenazine biosynthesis protein [Desulfovibrio desulfuricans]|nr:PhzF family phenazine biosynthesis protein [Desulfovibrio desulfuricans]
MQQIAQEFRQFETIFLVRRSDAVFDARIFTVEEELDFAGHPVLGAAAVVQCEFLQEASRTVLLNLNSKQVSVFCTMQGAFYDCCMDQGPAEFTCAPEPEEYAHYLRPLNLAPHNVAAGFPLEVVSTGLPYLLVPLASGLDQARILVADYESRLAQIGAKFAYVFDVNAVEGRTWDNAGLAEDVATGSAAGPVGAYLYKHNRFSPAQEILLRQGRFVGRDSEISIRRDKASGNMLVSGQVRLLVRGECMQGM